MSYTYGSKKRTIKHPLKDKLNRRSFRSRAKKAIASIAFSQKEKLSDGLKAVFAFFEWLAPNPFRYQLAEIYFFHLSE